MLPMESLLLGSGEFREVQILESQSEEPAAAKFLEFVSGIPVV